MIFFICITFAYLVKFVEMIDYSELIAESDEDLEKISAALSVGGGDDGMFGVQYEFKDDDDDWNNDCVQALVDRDDAIVLARNVGVTVSNLPKAFCDKFDPNSSVLVPSEVEAIFKEILEFICDSGAKYKLRYL